MKVLITGATGMIGSEFARQCHEKGWEVVGIARPSAASRLAAVQDPTIHRVDILDREALRTVVRTHQPDIIAHFAAQAFNGTSWQMEDVTHTTNYLGTSNVLVVARELAPNAKILLACSSAEYGIVPDAEQPLQEERMLRPLTPYGVTKVATENLGYQYFINYGMKVYLPRFFIHVGTGHPPATMIQNFARQIALIKKGRAEGPLKVGRLDTARDFIDVRDGVRASLLLLEKGMPGVPVNIGTGVAHSGQQVLDLLFKIAGLSVPVESDTGLLRPSDETLLCADISRLQALGWKQEFSLEQTLTEVFNDWCERIAA